MWSDRTRRERYHFQQQSNDVARHFRQTYLKFASFQPKPNGFWTTAPLAEFCGAFKILEILVCCFLGTKAYSALHISPS